MNIRLTSLLEKVLLVFLFIIFIYYGKIFLLPLCFGGILATLFLPFCQFMERNKIPKILAVIACLLTLLLIISGIISVLGWKISGILNDINQMKEKIIEASNNFQQYIFQQFDITVADQLIIIAREQPSYTDILQTTAGSISALLTNLIVIYLYFLFLLYYRGHIKQFLLKLSKENNRAEMENIILNTTKVSQQYLIGISKVIMCLWILYSIGFSLIGVKNAIFFAVLCGFLEIIPYLGNIFGTFITIFIAGIQGGDITLLVSIAVVYIIVQTFQGWVLEPFILGSQVKINPLFTIIVLILGKLLWGIPGIILAIPLTAMFKIVCDHVESLKPYGFLIGEIETINKKKSFLLKNSKYLGSKTN